MATRRHFLTVSAAGLAWTGAGRTGRAIAQGAGKPTRVVVGFAPGGGADIVSRLVGERLRGSYAPTVIVENRPGAAGRIAIDAVKASEPDGSTMLVSPNPMITIYPHAFKKLTYDPLRDLTPITTLCSFPLILVCGPAMPAEVRTVGDLVTWARANPAKASFGTSATGSTLHFIGLTFARAAGIELQHVGYKGGAPAIQDVLGGQIPLAVSTPPTVVSLIRAGKLRALATTGERRSTVLPEVPNFKELGYAGLEMEDWFGMYLPSRAPAATVTRLNNALREALRSKEILDAFAKLMVEPGGESAEECAKRVADEYRMWGPIVKASGFVGED